MLVTQLADSVALGSLLVCSNKSFSPSNAVEEMHPLVTSRTVSTDIMILYSIAMNLYFQWLACTKNKADLTKPTVCLEKRLILHLKN